MATYVYEADDGERIERDFPIGQAPDVAYTCGVDLACGAGEGLACYCKVYRRIIAGVSVLVPGHMKASGDDERIAQRRQFVESGDAWLVKTGRVTTQDTGKAMEIINSRSESEIKPPPNFRKPGPAARAQSVPKVTTG